MQSGSSENSAPSSEGGNHCHPVMPKARSMHCDGEQIHPRRRAVPHNVAAHLSKWSNGIPLATITEHSSHSILHSHASLLTVDPQCACAYSGDNPPLAFRNERAPRGWRGAGLYNIQEHSNQGRERGEKIDYAAAKKSPSLSHNTSESPTPIDSHPPLQRILEAPQNEEAANQSEVKRLKENLRSVVGHIHSVSRHSKSRTSIMKANVIETQDDKVHTTKALGPPKLYLENEAMPDGRRRHSCCISGDAGVLQLLPTEESDNCASLPEWSSSVAEASGHSLVAMRLTPPNRHVPQDDLPLDSQLLLLPSHVNIPSKETPAPVTQRVIPREPQTDVDRGGDDLSAKCTFGNIPVSQRSGSLPRNSYCTQAPSFTSTISTSYSGTVLGVDLDLQQDFESLTHRLPTPASNAPARREAKTNYTENASNSILQKTITSSALPVLLPLAVASGIVKTNHTTPFLSFCSPSGNLIQTAEASTSSASSVSYYREELLSSVPVTEIAVRPFIAPYSTPLHSTVPLPDHLKQKQEENRRINSQTIPRIITPSNLNGCDGMIRKGSFTLRTGMRPTSTSTTTRSTTSNRKYFETNYPLPTVARSRFQTEQSCVSFPSKGRHSSEQEHKAKSGIRNHEVPKTHASELGPLAAWTLRVCFCQP